jgi:predicted dehydrogenase
MTPATVALLGCTHPHSHWHLATLRLLPEVAAVWLWDPDAAAARAAAPAAGEKLAGAADDLAGLLARPEVRVVVIARRNDETPATIRQAAAAGKHVLTEKPAATSAAALGPALAAVRAAGVTLGVLYPWRAHPAARELRQLIAAGLLGRPLSVEARLVTSQVRYRDPAHWLFRRGAAGGGVLSWLGCHMLDLIRYLLQEEVRSVTALTGQVSGAAIEVEDAAALALEFASGALGTFHCAYALPRSAAGYRGAAYDTWLAVRGSEGRFSWDPRAADPVVRIERAGDDWATAPEREFRYTLAPSEAYGGAVGLEFVREFLRAAAAGGAPPAGGEDALQVLRLIDAAYASAATGRRVELEGEGGCGGAAAG